MIRGLNQKYWAISRPDPYPEIGFERTLGRLILEIIELSGHRTDLRNESSKVFSARFCKERRTVTVGTDGNRRVFLSTFSSKGVNLAVHDTSDLRETARGVELWLIDELALSDLEERLPNVVLSEGALEIEAGRGVEARWTALFATHDQQLHDPFGMPLEFLALARAAGRRPLLRQLVPVVSLWQFLSFSRTIGYPFLRVGGCVAWAGNDRYCALGPDNRLLGEGTVEEVLDIFERTLPRDTGPAIYGTADDLTA